MRRIIPFCLMVLVVCMPVLLMTPPTVAAQGHQGRIVFQSDRSGNRDIFVMNADGSGQTNLTNHPADDVNAAWSPDGSKIAFASNRDQDLTKYHIYVMNADGSAVTRLSEVAIDALPPIFEPNPTWSPDGQWVAVDFLNAGLIVWATDGSLRKWMLTSKNVDINTAILIRDPAWSPDGTRIAYRGVTIFANGTAQVFFMTVDGNKETQFTSSNGINAYPAWSQDATRLAWTFIDTADRENIIVANADGSNPVMVTADNVSGHPSWAPDGNRIAFASSRNGLSNDIYVLSSDGAVVNLTNNLANDSRPDWSRPLAPAPSANARCFAETGFCIDGRIREYWEQNGGLPVFGLPIGPQQVLTIEGKPVQAQWFERNRLELHPENQRPYDVLLGRLGADRLDQQQYNWQGVAPEAAQDGCRFFAETGRNVCGDILAAWRSNGIDLDGKRAVSEAESLALFGLPLTGVMTQRFTDGREYQVQYFERARFELHPENQPPYNVLLGLLGTEVRAQR